MIKPKLIKKAYSKPEIEFVVFNYGEVLAFSGEGDITDIGEEEEEEDGVLGALGFVMTTLGSMAPGSTSESTESETETTAGGGLGEIFGTSDGTDTGSTEYKEDSNAEVATEGFFEEMVDVIKGEENIDSGSYEGTFTDEGSDTGDTDTGNSSSDGGSPWAPAEENNN